MKSNRKGIALLLAITVFIPTTSANAASPSANPTNTLTCPDYLFVGARGSGEQTPHQKGQKNRDPYSAKEQGLPVEWMGRTVGTMFQTLAVDKDRALAILGTSNPSKKKTVAWLSYGVGKNLTSYPAIDVPSIGKFGSEIQNYTAEVSILNVGLLKTTVLPYASNCPNTQYILAGYSQGAAILRLAIARLDPVADAEFLKKIKSVILIADPLLSPSDPRLPVAGNGWTENRNTCGVVRVIATDDLGCYSTTSTAKLKIVSKSFEVLFSLSCAIPPNKEGSLCTSAQIRTVKYFIGKGESSAEIGQRQGIRNIISVCFTGDIVCAPLGERDWKSWQNPFSIHTDYYRDSNVRKAIVSWLKPNL